MATRNRIAKLFLSFQRSLPCSRSRRSVSLSLDANGCPKTKIPQDWTFCSALRRILWPTVFATHSRGPS